MSPIPVLLALRGLGWGLALRTKRTTLITVSTESGDGRHNDVKRELSGVFHAVTGANGRLKTGDILNVNAEGIDIYNTILQAMDVKERLGPKDRKTRPVDAIRA